MSIIIPSKYGDPRRQAQAEPRPRTQSDLLAERFEKFLPGLAGRYGAASRFDLLADTLPEGASWSRRTAAGRGTPDSLYTTVESPYMPELCLLEGSGIVMADGSRKPIEEVRVGDRVLDRMGSIQTVERAWCDGTPDEVVEIVLWGGKTIRATKSHDFPARLGTEHVRVPAASLTTEHELLIPRGYDASAPPRDREIAKLLSAPTLTSETVGAALRWPMFHKLGVLTTAMSGDLSWAKLSSPDMASRVQLLAAQVGILMWIDEDDPTVLYREVDKSYHVDDDFIYLPIRSVAVVENSKRVYNLSVSGDHSYLVDNVATYNSSDRQNYPIHRLLANRYWRMFYKLDPIVGTCTDLISDMPWSNFELTGEGIDGEVRDTYEVMCERTELLSIFPYLTREWLSVGEAIPHTFYSEDEGIWTHIAMHNPDQIEVTDSPFLRMDPILQFTPDDRLRAVLSSSHPVMHQIRQTLPPDVLSRIEAREGITLSPLNATLIARKMHPYESRGTSIYSRLWRIFMYEDAIFNSCFTGDTPVLMDDGSHKPIRDVKIGDMVLDRMGLPARVEDAWEEPPPAKLVEIHLQHGLEPIRCTLSHEFPALVSGRSTRARAGDLSVGDALLVNKSLMRVPGLQVPEELAVAIHNSPRIAENIYATILRVEVVDNDEPVYNLTVEGDHSYVVGYVSTFNSIQTARRAACFVAGTRVMCEDGLRNIEDIEPGDRVIAGDGRVETVEAAWREPPSPTVTIQVLGSEPMTCTPNHNFLIRRGNQLIRLPAEEIRKGDYLLTPRKYDEDPSGPAPASVTALGYFLAHPQMTLGDDGSAQSITISVPPGSYGDSTVSDCMDALLASGAEVSSSLGYGADGVAVSVVARPASPGSLDWLLDYVADGCARLTPAAMRMPIVHKKNLLKALLGYYVGRADGPVARIPIQSETLAHQLRLICAQVGVISRLSRDGGPWVLEVDRTAARPLLTHNQVTTHTAESPGGWMDPDYVYMPVLSVERNETLAYVYNLSVSGDHSYLVGTTQTFNSPVKVAKLGSEQSGWIPGPEHERRLLELLTQAEVDPQCLTPDTPINLADGSYKAAGELLPGDKLIDMRGDPCEVVSVELEDSDDIVEISLAGQSGTPIRSTATHRWPVARFKRRLLKTGAPSGRADGRVRVDEKQVSEVTAAEIQEGDYLMIPRRFQEVDPGISLDQAKLLGYYLADGSSVVVRATRGMGAVIGSVFSINARDAHVVDDICRILKDLTGDQPEVFTNEDKGITNVRARTLASHDLSVWLKEHANAGSHASTKMLKGDVMRWPLAHKQALIDGYLLGDGCGVMNPPGRAQTGYIECATVSEQLIKQLQLIFAQLGTWAPYRQRTQPAGSFSPGNTIYSMRVDGPYTDAVLARLWGKDIQRRSAGGMMWRKDDDYIYVRIRGVERKPYGGQVVNISVDSPDHSYVALNSCSLNSWLVYHWGVNFELVGAPERAMNIGREWDHIERVKLIALGISRSFLTGEVTYACLKQGTLVMMADGSEKPIEDVEVGDLVMDRHYRPKKVEAAWCSGTPSHMISLSIMGHDTISCTENHNWPAWVWDGPDSETGREEKTRADQLRVGDYLMVPLEAIEGVDELVPEVGREPQRGSPWRDDTHMYVPITKVMRYHNTWKHKVYNLTVEDTHSYIANGVATYNSAATGLQVFMQRLRAIRTMFETAWLYPKFFLPIAMMREWVRPKPSELAHGFRVKRSKRELLESGRYLVPRLVWDRKLDSSINMEVINAMSSLEQLGVKFSKTTKMATIGYSFEEETRKIHRELEFERAEMRNSLAKPEPQGQADSMPPMGGPPMPPLMDMGMGDDLGGDPGMDFGGDPGMDPGADPSMDPGMDPGTDPGADIPVEASRRTAARQKTIRGVTFMIQYDRGDTRSGTDAKGRKWSRKMNNCYGYIPKSRGLDGECVDVYLRENGTFDKVYVVHQRRRDGTYDEDKVMVGYPTKVAAKKAYLRDMPKWALGPITTMRWDDFVGRYIKNTRKAAAADWRAGRYKNWTADEVMDLLELVEEGDTQDPFWSSMLSCDCRGPHRRDCGRRDLLIAFDEEDWDTIWERVRDHLIKSGYPDRDIEALAEILVAEGKLRSMPDLAPASGHRLESMLDGMDDDDPSFYTGRY